MSKANKVLKILKSKSGKTLGATIRVDGSTKDVSTDFLRSNRNLVFNNAVIDKNGYVRSKSGSLHVEILDRECLEVKGLTLYHGSTSGIKLPISPYHSTNKCDFGSGFYMCNISEQATHRVHQIHSSVIYEVILDTTGLSCYRFNEDIEGSTLWALYVTYNRGRLPLLGIPKLEVIFKNIDSHDVVIGHIADDKMATSFNTFMKGYTTNEVLYRALKEVKYGIQVVAKSKKACSQVYINRSRRLTKEDRINSEIWGSNIKVDLDRRIRNIIDEYRTVGLSIGKLMEVYK